MSKNEAAISPKVLEFVDKVGIGGVFDLDRNRNPWWHPVMYPIGRNGAVSQVITSKGADYEYAEIHYMNWANSMEELGRREVSVVGAGKRTELAYLAPESSRKIIKVHSGLGELVLMREGEEIIKRELLKAADSVSLGFDGVVQPGTFFTLRQGGGNSPEPLVVSAFEHNPQNPSVHVAKFGILDGAIPIGGLDVPVPEKFRKEFA